MNYTNHHLQRSLLSLSKATLLLTFICVAQFSYGQGFMSKLVGKLAGATGDVNVETTADLSTVVPSFCVMESNLYPAKVGTITQTFYKGWIDGGDIFGLGFAKKNSIKFVKIDGTVTIDGKPMDYMVAGTYGLITTPVTTPRKIEVTTSSGQKSAFTIEPSKKQVKIVSINGVNDAISLDLTKDVVLALEGVNLTENDLLKITIAINQLSIKSLYAVCYVKYGSTVTIPPAAFRNIDIKPGGSALFSYKKSFITVATEGQQEAIDVTGAFTAVQYTVAHTDGRFITVAKEPNLNKGLTVKGSDRNMDYTAFKPNAFLSRPFSQIKKIGLMSFSIRGTTYKQTGETSTYEGSQSTVTTTKITTLEFPQQPDEVWDAVLEKMYPELVAVVESEFGAKVLAPEIVTGSASYASVEAFSKDGVNTNVEFERSFRNSKVVSAFLPISDGFGANGVSERLMNETGTDGLMTVTLDLEISEQDGGDKVLMVPKMAFEIVGKANGINTSTKYFSGTVQSNAGVGFRSDLTVADLEGIIRKSDLVAVFAKAIKELKAAETANGDYEAVWNLRK